MTSWVRFGRLIGALTVVGAWLTVAGCGGEVQPSPSSSSAPPAGGAATSAPSTTERAPTPACPDVCADVCAGHPPADVPPQCPLPKCRCAVDAGVSTPVQPAQCTLGDGLLPCSDDAPCARFGAYCFSDGTSLVGVCQCPDLCVPGQDQTCNARPEWSSIHGTCNADGTCTCKPGAMKLPNGKCN